MTLPPKRFENPYDPRFDSIRGKSWFKQLERARRDLPRFQIAYQEMISNPKMTLRHAALMVGVDESVLGKFIKFTKAIPREQCGIDKIHQAVLDQAYQLYCSGVSCNFTECILRVGASYACNPLHVKDRWETDPLFRPTGYISG